MGASSVGLIGLALGVSVLLGTVLARRTGLPDPVALVVVGILASLVPDAPQIDLPPDLVFLVFLPPLVYRASFLTDPRSLRRLAAPLALLAVGLVIATAVVVAVLARLVVPGLPLREGLVLGAVLAPTDTVAPAAVFSRLGAPRRLVDVLEGESLINDATALVLYALAVQAVVQGPPGLGEIGLRLVLSVALGVAAGLVVGFAVLLLRRRIADTGLQLLLTLFTPYAAYVLAEQGEASGILAVVVAGVLLGSASGGTFTASVRLQGQAFWSLLELVLNAVLFVLLGLQVRRLLDVDSTHRGQYLLAAAVLVPAVIALRLGWQFLVPPVVYAARAALGLPRDATTAQVRFLVGWGGMRGAISLAAALAIPRQVGSRPLALFVTVVAVLVTLVVQGTTLPLLLQRLGQTEDDELVALERRARLALADVALARIEELEACGELAPGAGQPVRTLWQQTRARLLQDAPGPEGQVDLVALRLDIARVQAGELDRLRREEHLPAELVRELRTELDLQRVRLDRAVS